jgi:hypothetical protein
MCCANFCPIGVHAAPAKPIVIAHGKSVVYSLFVKEKRRKSRVSIARVSHVIVRARRKREKESERKKE